MKATTSIAVLLLVQCLHNSLAFVSHRPFATTKYRRGPLWESTNEKKSENPSSAFVMPHSGGFKENATIAVEKGIETPIEKLNERNDSVVNEINNVLEQSSSFVMPKRPETLVAAKNGTVATDKTTATDLSSSQVQIDVTEVANDLNYAALNEANGKIADEPHAKHSSDNTSLSAGNVDLTSGVDATKVDVEKCALGVKEGNTAVVAAWKSDVGNAASLNDTTTSKTPHGLVPPLPEQSSIYNRKEVPSLDTIPSNQQKTEVNGKPDTVLPRHDELKQVKSKNPPVLDVIDVASSALPKAEVNDTTRDTLKLLKDKSPPVVDVKRGEISGSEPNVGVKDMTKEDPKLLEEENVSVAAKKVETAKIDVKDTGNHVLKPFKKELPTKSDGTTLDGAANAEVKGKGAERSPQMKPTQNNVLSTAPKDDVTSTTENVLKPMKEEMLPEVEAKQDTLVVMDSTTTPKEETQLAPASSDSKVEMNDTTKKVPKTSKEQAPPVITSITAPVVDVQDTKRDAIAASLEPNVKSKEDATSPTPMRQEDTAVEGDKFGIQTLSDFFFGNKAVSGRSLNDSAVLQRIKERTQAQIDAKESEK